MTDKRLDARSTRSSRSLVRRGIAAWRTVGNGLRAVKKRASQIAVVDSVLAGQRAAKMYGDARWHEVMLADRRRMEAWVGIRHGDNNLQGFEVVQRCLHWLR